MTGSELITEEQHAKALRKARLGGKVVGWLQGGAVTALGFLAWRFIGLLPVIAVSALVLYVVYRLVFRGGKSDPE